MIKRKDRILISALELLEESGVNGLTTKRLATKEGITEPALYRQYKNKGQIIECIIEEYGSYDDKIRNTINESDMNGYEKVLFYVNRYCELYQNYKELTTVMLSMDLYYYDMETKKQMQDIEKKRDKFLLSMVEEGLGDGSIDSALPLVTLATVIDGIITCQVAKWRLQDDNGLLKERIMPLIEAVL